jgi:hypothetical protein
MNFNAITKDEGGIFDGGWRCPEPTKVPMGVGLTIITNRRGQNTSALMRYEQGSVLVQDTARSVADVTTSATVTAWGGYTVNYSLRSALLGPCLFFDYAVSDDVADKIGWYLSYLADDFSALRTGHPYKPPNPPPTL